MKISRWLVVVPVVAVLFCGCAHRTLDSVKAEVASYYESGKHERDVARIMSKAVKLLPAKGSYNVEGSAVVFDIDDTALNTYEYQKGVGFGHHGPAWHQWIGMSRATAIKPVLDFYNQAKDRGMPVFFVTGRREKFRAVTESNLRQCGFDGWTELFMKPDNFNDESVVGFKSGCRAAIESRGYKILINVGDQESDLVGGHCRHKVLLPNRIYGVK